MYLQVYEILLNQQSIYSNSETIANLFIFRIETHLKSNYCTYVLVYTYSEQKNYFKSSVHIFCNIFNIFHY